MLPLLTPKKIRVRYSFVMVCVLHLLFIFAGTANSSIKNGISSLPKSEKTVNKHLLDVVLKEFPIKILDDDVIIVKSKKVTTPLVKKNQKQKDKSDQKIKQSIDTLGESDRQNYVGIILAQLSKHKNYPEVERRREREGRVLVSFQVNPDGSIQDLSIKQKSNYESFNKEALNTVRKSSPFPKYEANNVGLKLTVAIDFKLDE